MGLLEILGANFYFLGSVLPLCISDAGLYCVGLYYSYYRIINIWIVNMQ